MQRLPNLSGLSTAEAPYYESVLGPMDPERHATHDMAVRYVPATDQQAIDAIVKFVKESTPEVVDSTLRKWRATLASYIGYDSGTRTDTMLTIEHTLQEVELCMEELQMPTKGMRSSGNDDNDSFEPRMSAMDYRALQASRRYDNKPYAMRPQTSRPNVLLQRQKDYLAAQNLSWAQRNLATIFVSIYRAIMFITDPVLALRLLLTTLAAPVTAPPNLHLMQ